jgi:hypothetical protein
MFEDADIIISNFNKACDDFIEKMKTEENNNNEYNNN